MPNLFRLGLLMIAILLARDAACRGQQRISPPANPRYERIDDDVYLQEIGRQIRTAHPVDSLAVGSDAVYAISGGSVYQIAEDKELRPLARAPAGARRLFAVGDAIWCSTDDATYHLAPGEVTEALAEVVVDVCMHLGKFHAATRSKVYRLDGATLTNIRPAGGWQSSDTTVVMPDGSQVLEEPVRLGPIQHLASYSGTLYVSRPDGLAAIDGAVLNRNVVDWGAYPSRQHRDLLAQGSRLWLATGRGLAVLRGAALTTITGRDGLPYEDTTCLAKGFARDLWIGTKTGAIRSVGDQYHYFGAEHWLPGDHVHALGVRGHTVYVGTKLGIGIIRYEPYTLRKKAAFFERNVAERHHLRLGFVHQLYWSGAKHGWLREISDNDGGHTAHYLAAMCFKYAVTGDPAARNEAANAFAALRWLQTITGTDGFFARAIWANEADLGHRATQGSGGLPAKWYDTPDGRWSFKGDTSSDEVDAHFYAVSLFHDLAAEGREKDQAAEHLARIARHIVANGWVLRDIDGEPTRWGRWDPDYVLRPYGFASRGLNGLEAQTYMWTALAMTGDRDFRQSLQQLLDWRYHTFTVREKVTFPPEDVVPWDDELAFRCFLPLLTYCEDPYLRSIYLRALARHWEVLRLQQVPFFNFVYGALTGNDCEARAAVEHLRAWSLDTISHSFRNSHRADLVPEPGYTPYAGGTRAISPRESACMWGSRSALAYDGRRGGRVITPPVGWLEDYWMGRYYGMIADATVADRKLISVSGKSGDPIAAAAYQGPSRPEPE